MISFHDQERTYAELTGLGFKHVDGQYRNEARRLIVVVADKYTVIDRLTLKPKSFVRLDNVLRFIGSVDDDRNPAKYTVAM